MTKDDKLLRETVLAELRRRRGLLSKDEERPRPDPSVGRPSIGHAARAIYEPSPPAGTTSE
jgi:hypothetical protein